MAGLSQLGPALRRDQIAIGGGVLFTTAVAWAYMVREARGMSASGVCECMGMAMAGPDTAEWSATHWAALFLMWAEMMLAMMLPSAAPMMLIFASVNRKRRERQRPFVPVAVFALGYVVVWTAFSAGATGAQWGLHRAAWLNPAMAANSRWLGAGLMGAAGLFQFTGWKSECLVRCANPLSFLLTEWRDGYSGAFRMGVRHGAFCLGCCWLLMLLLFVFGVMNVLWIALLTAYVLMEKLLGQRKWVGWAGGVAMCATALWVALH